jgi:thiol-disulfide isomerase/thioredoxin
MFLLAVHDSGVARIATNEFSTNMTVKLESWGRIEGTRWRYDEAVTNESVSAEILSDDDTASSRYAELETKTDAHGRFSFEFVPPGKFAVFSSGMTETTLVKSGGTAAVKIGGSGRPVVGKFKIRNPNVEIEWGKMGDYYLFDTALPIPSGGFKTDKDYEAWRKQPEFQRALVNGHARPLQCAKDGSFRIDQVEPGNYEMMAAISDLHTSRFRPDFIAQYDGTFEIPAGKPNTREPLDLGVIEIPLRPQIVVGETTAPEFEVNDIHDHNFKLADFHGKYVLLDFWAIWFGSDLDEVPYLKQVHEKFKDRKDFVIISMCLDEVFDERREFLKTNDLPWVQHVGNRFGKRVANQYGVQRIPALFLVSPEGKIVETGLDGGSMIAQIEKHLK